jgi:hypothetical protein
MHEQSQTRCFDRSTWKLTMTWYRTFLFVVFESLVRCFVCDCAASFVVVLCSIKNSFQYTIITCQVESNDRWTTTNMRRVKVTGCSLVSWSTHSNDHSLLLSNHCYPIWSLSTFHIGECLCPIWSVANRTTNDPTLVRLFSEDWISFVCVFYQWYVDQVCHVLTPRFYACVWQVLNMASVLTFTGYHGITWLWLM